MNAEFETRIDSSQGNYLVASSREIEASFEKVKLNVEGLDVMPGQFTDLYGWFLEPVQYVGMLNSNMAIFYLGKGNSTLFEEGGEYYDITMIIAPTRIGKSYKAGTFRDVHLKKNKKGEYMFL